MQPVAVIEAGNVLGECILWDPLTQTAWWTDIEAKQLLAFDWRAKTLNRFTVPERLTAFGFVTGRADLIGAFESGFALFSAKTGLQRPIMQPEGLLPGMRMNDGRVDRQGRFWAGAMVEDPQVPAVANLYCVQDRELRIRERGIAISNGICWSPDSAWCYFADSKRHIIWRYAFDAETGEIVDPVDFARTSAGIYPDGAAVDAEGYLWSAQWGGGCVVRYAPDGRIDRVLEIPVSQPTCVAFGGPDLDLLFVTTARIGLGGVGLSVETGAGNVFVYNVGVQGLPESRFNLRDWPSSAELGE